MAATLVVTVPPSAAPAASWEARLWASTSNAPTHWVHKHITAAAASGVLHADFVQISEPARVPPVLAAADELLACKAGSCSFSLPAGMECVVLMISECSATGAGPHGCAWAVIAEASAGEDAYSSDDDAAPLVLLSPTCTRTVPLAVASTPLPVSLTLWRPTGVLSASGSPSPTVTAASRVLPITLPSAAAAAGPATVRIAVRLAGVVADPLPAVASGGPAASPPLAVQRYTVAVALSRGSGELLTAPKAAGAAWWRSGAADTSSSASASVLSSALLPRSGLGAGAPGRWEFDWEPEVAFDDAPLSLAGADCADVHLLLYVLVPPAAAGLRLSLAAAAGSAGESLRSTSGGAGSGGSESSPLHQSGLWSLAAAELTAHRSSASGTSTSGAVGATPAVAAASAPASQAIDSLPTVAAFAYFNLWRSVAGSSAPAFVVSDAVIAAASMPAQQASCPLTVAVPAHLPGVCTATATLALVPGSPAYLPMGDEDAGAGDDAATALPLFMPSPLLAPLSGDDLFNPNKPSDGSSPDSRPCVPEHLTVLTPQPLPTAPTGTALQPSHAVLVGQLEGTFPRGLTVHVTVTPAGTSSALPRPLPVASSPSVAALMSLARVPAATASQKDSYVSAVTQLLGRLSAGSRGRQPTLIFHELDCVNGWRNALLTTLRAYLHAVQVAIPAGASPAALASSGFASSQRPSTPAAAARALMSPRAALVGTSTAALSGAVGLAGTVTASAASPLAATAASLLMFRQPASAAVPDPTTLPLPPAAVSLVADALAALCSSHHGRAPSSASQSTVTLQSTAACVAQTLAALADIVRYTAASASAAAGAVRGVLLGGSKPLASSSTGSPAYSPGLLPPGPMLSLLLSLRAAVVAAPGRPTGHATAVVLADRYISTLRLLVEHASASGGLFGVPFSLETAAAHSGDACASWVLAVLRPSSSSGPIAAGAAAADHGHHGDDLLASWSTEPCALLSRLVAGAPALIAPLVVRSLGADGGCAVPSLHRACAQLVLDVRLLLRDAASTGIVSALAHADVAEAFVASLSPSSLARAVPAGAAGDSIAPARTAVASAGTPAATATPTKPAPSLTSSVIAKYRGAGGGAPPTPVAGSVPTPVTETAAVPPVDARTVAAPPVPAPVAHHPGSVAWLASLRLQLACLLRCDVLGVPLTRAGSVVLDGNIMHALQRAVAAVVALTAPLAQPAPALTAPSWLVVDAIDNLQESLVACTRHASQALAAFAAAGASALSPPPSASCPSPSFSPGSDSVGRHAVGIDGVLPAAELLSVLTALLLDVSSTTAAMHGSGSAYRVLQGCGAATASAMMAFGQTLLTCTTTLLDAAVKAHVSSAVRTHPTSSPARRSATRVFSALHRSLMALVATLTSDAVANAADPAAGLRLLLLQRLLVQAKVSPGPLFARFVQEHHAAGSDQEVLPSPLPSPSTGHRARGRTPSLASVGSAGDPSARTRGVHPSPGASSGSVFGDGWTVVTDDDRASVADGGDFELARLAIGDGDLDSVPDSASTAAGWAAGTTAVRKPAVDDVWQSLHAALGIVDGRSLATAGLQSASAASELEQAAASLTLSVIAAACRVVHLDAPGAHVNFSHLLSASVATAISAGLAAHMLSEEPVGGSGSGPVQLPDVAASLQHLQDDVAPSLARAASHASFRHHAIVAMSLAAHASGFADASGTDASAAAALPWAAVASSTVRHAGANIRALAATTASGACHALCELRGLRMQGPPPDAVLSPARGFKPSTGGRSATTSTAIPRLEALSLQLQDVLRAAIGVSRSELLSIVARAPHQQADAGHAASAGPLARIAHGFGSCIAQAAQAEAGIRDKFAERDGWAAAQANVVRGRPITAGVAVAEAGSFTTPFAQIMQPLQSASLPLDISIAVQQSPLVVCVAAALMHCAVVALQTPAAAPGSDASAARRLQRRPLAFLYRVVESAAVQLHNHAALAADDAHVAIVAAALHGLALTCAALLSGTANEGPPATATNIAAFAVPGAADAALLETIAVAAAVASACNEVCGSKPPLFSFSSFATLAALAGEHMHATPLVGSAERRQWAHEQAFALEVTGPTGSSSPRSEDVSAAACDLPVPSALSAASHVDWQPLAALLDLRAAAALVAFGHALTRLRAVAVAPAGGSSASVAVDPSAAVKGLMCACGTLELATAQASSAAVFARNWTAAGASLRRLYTVAYAGMLRSLDALASSGASSGPSQPLPSLDAPVDAPAHASAARAGGGRGLAAAPAARGSDLSASRLLGVSSTAGDGAVVSVAGTVKARPQEVVPLAPFAVLPSVASAGGVGRAFAHGAAGVFASAVRTKAEAIKVLHACITHGAAYTAAYSDLIHGRTAAPMHFSKSFPVAGVSGGQHAYSYRAGAAAAPVESGPEPLPEHLLVRCQEIVDGHLRHAAGGSGAGSSLGAVGEALAHTLPVWSAMGTPSVSMSPPAPEALSPAFLLVCSGPSFAANGQVGGRAFFITRLRLGAGADDIVAALRAHWPAAVVCRPDAPIAVTAVASSASADASDARIEWLGMGSQAVLHSQFAEAGFAERDTIQVVPLEQLPAPKQARSPGATARRASSTAGSTTAVASRWRGWMLRHTTLSSPDGGATWSAQKHDVGLLGPSLLAKRKFEVTKHEPDAMVEEADGSSLLQLTVSLLAFEHSAWQSSPVRFMLLQPAAISLDPAPIAAASIAWMEHVCRSLTLALRWASCCRTVPDDTAASATRSPTGAVLSDRGSRRTSIRALSGRHVDAAAEGVSPRSSRSDLSLTGLSGDDATALAAPVEDDDALLAHSTAADFTAIASAPISAPGGSGVAATKQAARGAGTGSSGASRPQLTEMSSFRARTRTASSLGAGTSKARGPSGSFDSGILELDTSTAPEPAAVPDDGMRVVLRDASELDALVGADVDGAIGITDFEDQPRGRRRSINPPLGLDDDDAGAGGIGVTASPKRIRTRLLRADSSNAADAFAVAPVLPDAGKAVLQRSKLGSMRKSKSTAAMVMMGGTTRVGDAHGAGAASHASAAALLSPQLARAVSGGAEAGGAALGTTARGAVVPVFGQMTDPFASSRMLKVPTGDYKPALDINAMATKEVEDPSFEDEVEAAEEVPLLAFLDVAAALQAATASVDDVAGIPRSVLPIYSKLPATVAVLLPARLLARVLHSLLSSVLSGSWAFPCGLRVGRQLLSDYAELKVTWCEKVVTEKRREWIREENALVERGIDVSQREMPDFAKLINRKPSNTILRLESLCLSTLQHIMLGATALDHVNAQCAPTMAHVTTARPSAIAAALAESANYPVVAHALLLDSISAVFVGLEAVQGICASAVA